MLILALSIQSVKLSMCKSKDIKNIQKNINKQEKLIKLANQKREKENIRKNKVKNQYKSEDLLKNKKVLEEFFIV
jgi:hypothetical protein